MLDRASPPLGTYLAANGISCAAFARTLGGGVTDSAVWRWACGERRPSIESLFAIERVTSGAVPASAWVKVARSRRGRKALGKRRVA